MLPHDIPPQLCAVIVERGNTQDKLNIRYEIATDLLLPDNISPQAEQMILKRVSDFATVCGSGSAMFAHKNLLYGDAIRFGGVLGAIYEMYGIVGRLHSLAVKPPNMVDNAAAISDALEDLHNYAAIARMLLTEGNYKGEMFG